MIVTNGTSATLGHDEHLDKFQANLSATVDPAFNIAGFDFHIRAEHVIPEPSALVLCAGGIIVLFACRQTRSGAKRREA
jgi:hypothetical protein